MKTATQTTGRAMLTLQTAMRDAHEALRLAMTENRWREVGKYAGQLEDLRAEHARNGFGIFNIAADGRGEENL